MTKSITPREAKDLMAKGHRYLDVRTEQEFWAGHPAEAVLVPAFHRGPSGMIPNPDFQRIVEANFPHDTPLVVGCHSGGRSAKACEILAGAGYTQIANVLGGFGGGQDPATGARVPGWREEGLDVETGGEALRA